MRLNRSVFTSILLLSIYGLSSCNDKSNNEDYEVKLETYGGKLSNFTITFKEGETLSNLPIPTKEGNKFIGWYYEDTFATQALEGDPINSDITLYANYVEVEYINSIDDLKNIDPNKNYVLNNDLDFNGNVINPIGDYKTPFSGYFFGENHNIKNYQLQYNKYNGLFGYVTGKIYDLSVITDISYVADNSNFVGLLAGYLYKGEVFNSRCEGQIIINSLGENGQSYIGGLIGENESGNINRCYSNVSISNTNDNSSYVGGLVGYNGGGKVFESIIKNSYAYNSTINVTSNKETSSSYVGGISGYNFGTIEKCFTFDMNLISRTSEYYAFCGGVCGDNNGGIIKDSFSSSNVKVISDSGTTFRGLVMGRNFVSTKTPLSGTYSNCYGYEGSKISYSLSNKESLLTSRHYQTVVPLVSYEEISKKDFFINTLSLNEFLVKDDYYPSLGSSFFKIKDVDDLGLPSNPIEIKSITDLMNIDTNKSYILKNDLDLRGKDLISVGTYDLPYYGVFDGNNHTIKFDVSKDNSLGYSSLFGYLNGTIKNLNTIANIDLVSNNNLQHYASGMVSYAINSYINNCNSEVNIDISSNGVIASGIVSYSEDSEIYGCSSSGIINTNSTNYSNYASGIVGINDEGLIRECFSIIDLNLKSEEIAISGGAVAKNLGKVYNSYSISNIKTLGAINETNIGGFVGLNKNGYIYNSYSISNFEKNNEANHDLIGGFGGVNIDGNVSNSYFQVNEGIKYSFGSSEIDVEITKVNDEELKTLSTLLGDKFVDKTDGRPHLKIEDNL